MRMCSSWFLPMSRRCRGCFREVIEWAAADRVGLLTAEHFERGLEHILNAIEQLRS